MLFTSYVSSLFQFTGQFCSTPPKVRKEYVHTVQCLTKCPWQAFPTDLLYNVTALSSPVDVHDVELITLKAQIRTVRESKVLENIRELIAEVADSDGASLNPHGHGTPHPSCARVADNRRHVAAGQTGGRG